MLARQRLLRTHVVRRPHGHAGLGELVASGLADRPGDPEVRHQRVALLDQDVLRLDVAVDDAVGMGVVQRVGDLAGDLNGVGKGQLLLPVEPGPQRLTLDERHDVVEEAGGLARVVQRENVRDAAAGPRP